MAKEVNGNGAPKVKQLTIAVPAELVPIIAERKLAMEGDLGLVLSTSQIVHSLIRKGLNA
jgi:hypothetical protein